MSAVRHAGQVWQALDLYRERGEIESSTANNVTDQARECLERACYTWDDFVSGVVAAWVARTMPHEHDDHCRNPGGCPDDPDDDLATDTE